MRTLWGAWGLALLAAAQLTVLAAPARASRSSGLGAIEVYDRTSGRTLPVHGYPAGSWGPAEAEKLLAGSGRRWRTE